MENKDFNFEEIKRRLENYEQTPNPEMWQKIEKQIRPNHIYLKGAIAITSLLLLAFVSVLIFTPSEKADTTLLTQEKKTEKIIIKSQENISKNQEIKTKNQEIISKKEIIETKKKNEQTLTVVQAEEKIEKQETKIVEQKQEIVQKTQPKQEIKQKEQTPIVEKEIAEQKHSPKAPETEEIENRFQLIIPNAFTPTSGDKNSIFKPASTELKDYKMHIYSSNGTLVFVSNNIEQGWDGTFKGNLQPMGVYVYVVKFTTPNGETRQQKGDLMLIR